MTIPRQTEKANLSQIEIANASVPSLLLCRQRRLTSGLNGNRFQFLSPVAIALHHEDLGIIKDSIQRT